MELAPLEEPQPEMEPQVELAPLEAEMQPAPLEEPQPDMELAPLEEPQPDMELAPLEAEMQPAPLEEPQPEMEPAPLEEKYPQITSYGLYKLSGIYKPGLEIYLNDFLIKPTQNFLQCGDKRIKNYLNPFFVLLNNKYEIILKIEFYMMTIQIGKTIIYEKISNIPNLLSNQDIELEQLEKYF
jgi:hypothetical protein